jgi:hypothetical protein
MARTTFLLITACSLLHALANDCLQSRDKICHRVDLINLNGAKSENFCSRVSVLKEEGMCIKRRGNECIKARKNFSMLCTVHSK